MNSSLSQKIHNKLIHSLMNESFINELSLDIKIIRENISEASFINKVNEMTDEKDFSCKAVYSLCKNLLKQVCGTELPDNWLYYVYQFTLNKSFPNAIDINTESKYSAAIIFYLKALRVLSEFEKNINTSTCQSKYPLNFLNAEEEKSSASLAEYRQFKNIFNNSYAYEMMKLHQEITNHNTLDHVCGVHHLSLFIGRQIKNYGLPIDLGKLSGAAAGHDIGKYGCSRSEYKRVPYLHYYYTDLWYKKHDIPYIGHIATYHSTWDLELENLPIESLVLIYSDFRVKNKELPDGSRIMHIYSLRESFNIILNKLDNVDSEKEKRYRRVYSKLKDFEDFITNAGVNVNLDNSVAEPNKVKRHISFMQGQEIIENIKYKAIEHNIHVMNIFRNEASLNSILEMAAGETDWKKLRGYINIFEEYSAFLTQRQKLITLNFLYDFLTHKEEDVRKQCAQLIGSFIAIFDEVYRKEVPDDVNIASPEVTSSELLDKYIGLFLSPDHKIIEAHRKWIGFSLGDMITSLFKHCNKEQGKDYINVLFKYYEAAYSFEWEAILYLIQTVKCIPFNKFDDLELDRVLSFIGKMTDSYNLDIELSALESIYYLSFQIDKKYFNEVILKLSDNASYPDIPAINYLKYKISEVLSFDENTKALFKSYFLGDYEKIGDVFLKNLKTATSWIIKKTSIDFLLELGIESPRKNGLHTAMHYCNLIKVSATENVRTHAGLALLHLFPYLTLDEKNDVSVELLRALEMQGFQFTKYIPPYLGRMLLYLHPVELDEIIDDFIEKIKQSSSQVTFLLLRTIGSTISNYPQYKERFNEDTDRNIQRLKKMLGILLNGLVNYDYQINHEAFRVIGKEIFGSSELSLKEKGDIFKLILKKILTLLVKIDRDKLTFLSNSAALNHIYRFISDYVFFYGEFDISHNSNVAFYPGTFDPFSLGHKEIAKAIRNLGFEVYLAVDEFSWSKRTQPNLLRREIINMSIADELGIHLFPEDIQVNITNDYDLKALRDCFPNSNVHMVAGSDVILNASSYKNKETESSIHSFPHIIFDRRSFVSTEHDDKKLEKAIQNISGKIIRLTLPPQYEDISSTQIRTYIDENRDISQLIDPLAQKYIYEYGVYRKEPQYKTLFQTTSIDIEVIEKIDETLISSLCQLFFNNNEKAYERIFNLKTKFSPRIILLRDKDDDRKILGFSMFHWIRSGMFYGEFENQNVSEYIRQNAVGRVLLVDGIYIDHSSRFSNLNQVLLTETLSFCLAKDYTYAVFKSSIDTYLQPDIYETLELQGFQLIPFSDEKNPIYAVNMTNPCTLSLDIKTVIKEPFKSNENVIGSINRARKRLQLALTRLYPGNLVLPFDIDILHKKLINKICETNVVPTQVMEPRTLGGFMCVPFGSILKGSIIPNTVTKSMHTEKRFESDLKSSTIVPSQYYMNLENQIKLLHSFNRPVILIDDLLHKGYRMNAISPLLNQEGITVEKTIVGILSGRGKELMDAHGNQVDSAYFIPNLRVWFNESLLYPFMGGDSVWTGDQPKRYMIPSINLIMPYMYPKFIKNTTGEAIINLSEICILNSIDILQTIEREYLLAEERNFTLKHLGEVFTYPRCPELGRNIEYDLNLKPSEYLKNDIERLNRIRNIVR
ncbi:cytidyltransferase [Proteiniborus sp. MB09-C3]|uniref:nicotinate-nicotinamide nucleotide adenylyltransferase n=1 Tax=Proteiniborus sp. MB09-C3 TaxID=3050072 RepID=UPI002553157D|nr:cytidyltransferase [Proteiniborus sp. MB09-C3]WIV10439.1 cytidyltransferase [Proteiniborus sp. MB09-C3]